MKYQASAPGKAILVGEHAVVYGAPAIALPLSGIRAWARSSTADYSLTIIAEDLDRSPLVIDADESEPSDPLALMVRLTMQYLGVAAIQGEVRIRSQIPIASGLGSGAAVSTALGRATAQLHEVDIPNSDLNELVFEVEKRHHGTPSGIDNTVVVYEKPLYFVKDGNSEFINVADNLMVAIADTGIASLTRDAVAAVRAQVQSSPTRTRRIFDEIGAIAQEARDCIERGNTGRLGELMTANHHLLRALNVSSPELDRLVEAAETAGAHGAKLSGGGLGGNIIALVDHDSAQNVAQSLFEAGAKHVMVTAAGTGSQSDDSN